MKRRYPKKTKFVPQNPGKYVGKYPIVCRSSWERNFAQWLDCQKQVLEWSSEGIIITYFDPVFGKMRRYFPDFYMKTKAGKFIIEIKPYKETIPPRKSKKKSRKTVITEQNTYKRNQAKFEAAERFAENIGMTFKIYTERELYKK
jgi:hypothetical protein